MSDPRITGNSIPSFVTDQSITLQDTLLSKLQAGPPNDPFEVMKQFFETLSPTDAKTLFDQLKESNPLSTQFNDSFNGPSGAKLLSILGDKFQTPAPVSDESVPALPSPIASPKAGRALKNEMDFGVSVQKAQIEGQLPEDSFDAGESMARIAVKDPAGNKKAIIDALNQLPEGERDDFAWSFTAHLSDEELLKLASTPDGRELLKRMNQELKTGRMDSDEIDQSQRIYNALKVNKRLTELRNVPGFDKLSEATQKSMLNAMQKYGDDPDFSNELKKLVGTEEFTSLPNDQARTKVIKDLGKFTETRSYAMMSSKDPADRSQALNIIKTLSIDAEGGGSNTAVARNTLKQLVDGKVMMELRDIPNEQLDGEALRGKVIFNMKSENLFDTIDDLVTTAAHEVNHVLNGNTQDGTVERFLDEYRAFFVERTAVGENPPSVESLRNVLKNLATSEPSSSSAYNNLRNLYKNNPQFKAVVDRMMQNLNAKPPKITTPEQLRVQLRALPGGANSAYLNRTSNLDNH